MKLSEIKAASTADLFYYLGKTKFSQGNGPEFSQMLENRIEKIEKELKKRGEL